MATIHKAASRAAEKKRKHDQVEDASDNEDVEMSKKPKRNKQRVLMLSSRGVTSRMRHLMADLAVLLPHAKKGAHSLNVGLDIQTDTLVQTPNSTRKTSSACCLSSLISTRATTRYILRRGVTRTCTCGRQKPLTGPASSYTFKMRTPWMS